MREGTNATEICVRLLDWFMSIMQPASSIFLVEYTLWLTPTVIVDLNSIDLLLQRHILMMTALQNKPPEGVDGKKDNAEMARLMMVKTTNTLVGKRELTGQQTASFLLGRKNNYTSDVYQEYWWSSMLRDIARDVFTVDLVHDHSHATAELNEESELEIQDSEEAERMIIPDKRG
ncbi:hypothetical protein C8R44DRAFT_751590 [Mycena epipterygia]|nr:hypothetical protein C8R44DRAFT_751590 [Mycena epipterygia]